MGGTRVCRRGEACLALVWADPPERRVKKGDTRPRRAHDGSMHHRRSLRFDRWDYREVAVYFVTITTQARTRLFGTVAGGQVMLSASGEIAQREWLNSAALRAEVELDLFVVMPNHVHGLVVLLPKRDLPELPTAAARFAAGSLGAL